jgi:hypothetical protein
MRHARKRCQVMEPFDSIVSDETRTKKVPGFY